MRILLCLVLASCANYVEGEDMSNGFAGQEPASDRPRRLVGTTLRFADVAAQVQSNPLIDCETEDGQPVDATISFSVQTSAANVNVLAEVLWGADGAAYSEIVLLRVGKLTMPVRGSYFRVRLISVGGITTVVAASIAIGRTEKATFLAINSAAAVAVGGTITFSRGTVAAPYPDAVTDLIFPSGTGRVKVLRTNGVPFTINLDTLLDAEQIGTQDQMDWLDVHGAATISLVNNDPANATTFSLVVELDT